MPSKTTEENRIGKPDSPVIYTRCYSTHISIYWNTIWRSQIGDPEDITV